MASTLALGLLVVIASPAVVTPPTYARRAAVTKVHGETLTDEYKWVEKRAAVEKILRAENAYAASVMAPLAGVRKEVASELHRYLDVTYDLPPLKLRDWYYYERHDAALEHTVRFRRNADGTRVERLIDLNRLQKRGGYIELGDWDISFDDRLVAYSVDTDGSEVFTLTVHDIATGKLVDRPIRGVTDFTFAGNDVLYYVVQDPVTHRSHRVYRHRIGDKQRDSLVYDEKDPAWEAELDITRSDAFLILRMSSHRGSEIRVLPLGKPDATWQTIVPRQAQVLSFLDHRGDFFFLRTDDGAPNSRLLKSRVDATGPRQWTEVVGPRAEQIVEGFMVFERFTAVELVENTVPSLLLLDADDRPLRTVKLDQPVYELALSPTLDFHSPTVRYETSTPIRPERIEEIDPFTGKTDVIFEKQLPGVDLSKYEVERIWVPTADHKMIPVTLSYRKDLRDADPQPLLLRGYGAYGDPMSEGFSAGVLPYLDRGIILGRAHVRGGGELGRQWHDGGRLANKVNTFTDFISVIEALIARGYTSPDKLAINGGSAGGLLIGAVLNLRPELCRTAVLEMPFVDVLGSMLNEKLPLTVGEREEWGDPRKLEDFRTMRQYSPYENLRAQPYPTVLVRAGLNDSRVMYWEAVKYVAKLRNQTTSQNPVLLRIDMDGGGHLGRSGRSLEIEDAAEDAAFYVWQLGLAVQP